MDEVRLARARELIKQRDEIDGELEAMFSGMPLPKRKWTRKTPQEPQPPPNET